MTKPDNWRVHLMVGLGAVLWFGGLLLAPVLKVAGMPVTAATLIASAVSYLGIGLMIGAIATLIKRWYDAR